MRAVASLHRYTGYVKSALRQEPQGQGRELVDVS